MFEIERFGLLSDGKKWLAVLSGPKHCLWGERGKPQIEECRNALEAMVIE